jgi:DNA-binding NarL/FixJ family response regulator
MTTMTFDRLAYIDRLKAAGFAEPQARAMADGLDQALREEVATKSDLAALRAELQGDLGLIRIEMGGLKGELLAAIKADKVDFLKWVVMLIVGQTAVFTALKLLGH